MDEFYFLERIFGLTKAVKEGNRITTTQLFVMRN